MMIPSATSDAIERLRVGCPQCGHSKALGEILPPHTGQDFHPMPSYFSLK